MICQYCSIIKLHLVLLVFCCVCSMIFTRIIRFENWLRMLIHSRRFVLILHINELSEVVVLKYKTWLFHYLQTTNCRLLIHTLVAVIRV